MISVLKLKQEASRSNRRDKHQHIFPLDGNNNMVSYHLCTYPSSLPKREKIDRVFYQKKKRGRVRDRMLNKWLKSEIDALIYIYLIFSKKKIYLIKSTLFFENATSENNLIRARHLSQKHKTHRFINYVLWWTLSWAFKHEIVSRPGKVYFVSIPNSTDAKPWSSDPLFLLRRHSDAWASSQSLKRSDWWLFVFNSIHWFTHDEKFNACLESARRCVFRINRSVLLFLVSSSLHICYSILIYWDSVLIILHFTLDSEIRVGVLDEQLAFLQFVQSIWLLQSQQ